MKKPVEKLSNVPRKPGVYKFLGQDGQVLYVGKAKNLRSRLSQYFGHSDTRAQLPFLMAESTDFDYVVVSSELESLYLESTLIKQYNPPYNIMLRDDKSFAFIKIDYSPEIPQISYSRTIEKAPRQNRTNKQTPNKFFGPYSSTQKIKKTLDLARRIFHFCSNNKVSKRPCFFYHLHRCPGVCVGQMSISNYQTHLEQIALFFSGKTSEIKKQLESRMHKASKQKKFEQATKFRDQYRALQTLEEKQISIFTKPVNWDFVSLFYNELSACVNLFKVRSGKLIDKENFLFEHTNKLAEKNKAQLIMQSFLENYYATTTDLPTEVFLQNLPTEVSIISKLLSERAKKKISITVPARTEKLKLINLGKINAEEYLLKWERNQASNQEFILANLKSLQNLLKLPSLPLRIECYDISNTQGTNPVSSMVVFTNGVPAKSEYRKFKITVKDSPDDFAMMAETLERRLKRIAPSKNSGNPSEVKTKKPDLKFWASPDLIVIDGGKGQLSAVTKVLKKKDSKIPVIGLAKRIEEIFLPNKSRPMVLSHEDPVLQLLQRLRDEAHRFGITFHKSLRSKQSTQSALDSISGIGPKTKKLLKQKFGTISQIRAASEADLAKIIGISKAKIIKKSL